MSTSQSTQNDVVDIIMPVFNSCEYTRQCLETIIQHVRIPVRVLIIDNASTDDTSVIIDRLREQCPRHIEISRIANTVNKGWLHAVNQGIELSKAPYIIISNNDILVYPNALEEMISVAEADARIGLVNPNSNEFGALASVQKVPLPASVERNYHESKGLSVERCSVIGFFALVKREVVQKIGGFDPAYSPGYSEDDDYSERARVEGYLCARALGAYVHHFGSKSFQTDQKKALKQRHETILRKRWGALRREAVLVRGNDLRDREQAESFCEKLKERLRKRTGYIYVFVPKSKRSLFALNHDYLRIKTYPSRGMGTLFFFLWRIFRKKSKPVVVISPDMLQDE